MVLLVLLLHAACAYAFSMPWWHVQDVARGQGVDILILAIDSFALPVLFFVSGTLVRASYERHGPSGYLRTKIVRLGFPLAALSCLYIPTMTYIGNRGRTGATEPFLHYWLHWMSGLADWQLHAYTSLQSAAPYRNIISPHHLWFLSLLLAFSLLYAAWNRWGAKGMTIQRLPWWGLLLVGTGISLGFWGGSLLTPDGSWVRFGPFFLAQPTRIPVYGVAFLFGIWSTIHLKRFNSLPGALWFWTSLFVFSLIFHVLWIDSKGVTHFESVLHGVLRGALAVSGICLVINAGYRFMNTAGTWLRSLNASSYEIYLLHMPLTVFAQTAMIGLAMPLSLKLVVAFLIPLLVCWGCSRIVAGRPPIVKIGGMLSFFAFFLSVF